MSDRAAARGRRRLDMALAGAALVYALLVGAVQMDLLGRLPPPPSTAAAGPATEPRTHVFNGGPYRTSFAAAFPPVLRIRPGDTIRTTTLDNLGIDAAGVRRSPPPNPQTGPFYVEGAEPGDTLAVTLDRLQLNRDTGHSGFRVVPLAVTGDYLRDAHDSETFVVPWTIDRARGLVALSQPTPALRGYTVPVKPMLGGIGVAPPGEGEISTTLGPWGGNLDYAALTEGTVVYLPVFRRGALLFLGDGHAVQGDGEVTRAAVETSMDVTVTVRLLKGQRIDGPRAETADAIMAMGVGDTFPTAVARATTGLLRWLEHDYGLTSSESAMILGSALRYDVAEIVDPRINIVARMPKAVLSTLPARAAR